MKIDERIFFFLYFIFKDSVWWCRGGGDGDSVERGVESDVDDSDGG